MIRIRKGNGDTVNLSHHQAIEIVDGAGLLGMVIVSDIKDTVRILVPGDYLFTAYCNNHKMKSSQMHVHDPFEARDMSED